MTTHAGADRAARRVAAVAAPARPVPDRARPATWTRTNLHLVLALAAVAELARTALPPAAGSAVVFAFALVVPGAAVVGWLPRCRPTTWVLLSVALSMVTWILVGTVMATAHAWQPTAVMAVVADVALAAHLRHAWVHRPRRSARAASAPSHGPSPVTSVPPAGGAPAGLPAGPALGAPSAGPPHPAHRAPPARTALPPPPPPPPVAVAAPGTAVAATMPGGAAPGTAVASTTVARAARPWARVLAGEGRRRVVLAAVLIGTALALWATAIGHLRLTNIATSGLLTMLPAAYFVALALVAVGFWRALARPQPHPLELAAYLFTLLWLLYAIVPVLDPTPRYTYEYTNFAVADAIARHGGIVRSTDLYQNWPGLFSMMAMIDRASGVSPLAYANWAQVAFAGLDVLAVGYVARGFTTDVRRVWATMWIALLADWIGQNYLAPQAVGYLLALVAVGVVLHNLPAKEVATAAAPRGAAARLSGRLWDGIARRPTVADPPPAPPAMHPGAALALVLALATAVAVTHPLSPFVLAAWLLVLVFTRRCRWRWLPFVVLLITLGWFWTAHTYVFSHFRVFASIGNLGANALGTSLAYPVPPLGQQLVQAAARLLSLGMWGAAALAAWLELRRGRRPSAVVALMATPFFLPLLYGYGGEAIYRTYLFGIPFTSFLIAGGLLHGTLRRSTEPRRLDQHRRRAVAGLAGTAVMAPLFLLSFYGLLAGDTVPPSAVAVDTWFGEHAAPDSVMYAICCGFPDVLSGKYAQFRNPAGVVGGNVVPEAVMTGRALTAADVTPALERLRAIGAPRVYVAISPLAATTARLRGLAPPASVDQFGQLLQATGEFSVVYRDGPSLLLEMRPAPPGSHPPLPPLGWRGP